MIPNCSDKKSMTRRGLGIIIIEVSNIGKEGIFYGKDTETAGNIQTF